MHGHIILGGFHFNILWWWCGFCTLRICWMEIWGKHNSWILVRKNHTGSNIFHRCLVNNACWRVKSCCCVWSQFGGFSNKRFLQQAGPLYAWSIKWYWIHASIHLFHTFASIPQQVSFYLGPLSVSIHYEFHIKYNTRVQWLRAAKTPVDKKPKLFKTCFFSLTQVFMLI